MAFSVGTGAAFETGGRKKVPPEQPLRRPITGTAFGETG
jgi:hypothetical protein